ncbi:MAG: sigma-70 family RNA polymerase sigma factor [Planctomycetota bacterium]|nr:MAG: sigma-70 family RNA polymerase sigma factor [Planctomycetota bacterium]
MDPVPARRDLEALLAHAGWVRALARSLVRDEAAADDLSQDAYVAALGARPPEQQASLRSWLHRVLRNLAADHSRSERRREAREQRAAAERPAPSPAAADAFERAALQRRLVEEVWRLDPIYREVVLLRFFEGLPPRRIAAALDLPVNTVRTRLRRALEQLRARLGDTVGTHWRASCLLLAATGRPGLLGGVAMAVKAQTVAAGVAVLALLAALLFLRPWRAPASSQHDHQEAQAPAADLAPPGTPEPPAERRALAATANAAHSTTGAAGVPGWTGVVLGGDGAPVAGAVVHAYLWGAEAGATTDIAGRFTLPWPARDWDLYGQVDVRASGWSLGTITDPPADPPAFVTVQLDGRHSLRVRTVDERTGAPVRGVEVLLRMEGVEDILALSGDDGLALLHAQAFGSAVLHGRGRGTAMVAPLSVELTPDAPGSILLPVRPYPQRARLLATDETTGLPILDARFSRVTGLPAWAWNEEGHPRAIIPASGGLAEVEALEGELPLSVLVEAEGYLPCHMSVVDTPEDPVRVLLRPLPATPFLVVECGQPVSEPIRVHYSAMAMGRRHPRQEGYVPHSVAMLAGVRTPPRITGTVLTDAHGFGVLPIPSGQEGWPDHFDLTLEAPSRQTRSYLWLARSEMPDPPWRLDLDPCTANVTVRVLDAHGLPRAGVEVEVTPAILSDSQDPREDRVRAATFNLYRPEQTGNKLLAITDASGECRFAIPAPSRPVAHMRVGPESVESSDWKTAPVLQPGGELTLLLRLPAEQALFEISGRVLLQGVSADSWTAEVELRPLDPAVRSHKRLARSGHERFHFEGLPAGIYELRLPELRDVPSLTVAAGATGIVLPVPELNSFRLEAVDAGSGERIPNVRVELWTAEGRWHLTFLRQDSNDGTIALKNWASDFERVEVRADGYAAEYLDLQPLSPERIASLRVEMQPSRTLRLRCFEPDGAPSPRVRRLRWEDAPWGPEDVSWLPPDRPPGVLRWPSAPRRALRVQAVDDSGQPLGAPVDVPQGESDLSLDVQLP